MRACTLHNISGPAITEIILRDLRQAISYVTRYEDEFIREVTEMSLTERNREFAKIKDELFKTEGRITELDMIIKRTHEDNISGKLTDERFMKLLGGYEREQDELRTAADSLQNDINECGKKNMNAKCFISAAKKYTDLQELDATVLRELIEKVLIGEKDKVTKTQEVHIHYNFIGTFDFQQAANQHTEDISSLEMGTKYCPLSQ